MWKWEEVQKLLWQKSVMDRDYKKKRINRRHKNEQIIKKNR